MNHTSGMTLKNSIPPALLIAHSPKDRIVGINNTAEIYQMAHHPKSFISLDGAYHLLSNEKDELYIGKVISLWAGRYISPAPTVSMSPDLKTRLPIRMTNEIKG